MGLFSDFWLLAVAELRVRNLRNEESQRDGQKKIAKRGSLSASGHMLTRPGAVPFMCRVWVGLLHKFQLCDFFRSSSDETCGANGGGKVQPWARESRAEARRLGWRYSGLSWR